MSAAPKTDILTAESSALDRALFRCRMCENAERFDDMVKCVKECCEEANKNNTPLGASERNYLSVAYKNSVASRRQALRCASSMKSRYEAKAATANVEIVTEYYATLLKELEDICMDVVNLVNDTIMPPSLLATLPDDRSSREFQVFFLKVNADYYRYWAEFADGDQKKQAIEKAADCYAKAVTAACEGAEEIILPAPHPVRLGLYLNYSVFLYEIQEKPEEAKKLAKQAFDDALDKLDSTGELEYKDSTLILQLLRDNTTLWSAQDTQAGTEAAKPSETAAPAQ